LRFWMANGNLGWNEPRVPADTEASIGRTDSKRALGFIVRRKHGDEAIDFVLDKDQVAELAAYLRMSLPRLLEPRGRKPNQISLVAMEELAYREWAAKQAKQAKENARRARQRRCGR